MDKIELKQIEKLLVRVALVFFVICLVVVFFFRTEVITGAVSRAIGIIEPFLWGGAIAYLLNPVCKFFEKYLNALDRRIGKHTHPGLVRMCGIILSLIFFFAILILFIMAVLPQLISSISDLVSRMPAAIERFQDWINSLDSGDMSHEAVTAVQEAVATLSQRLESFLKTDLLPTLEALVSNVTSSFMSILSVLKNFGLGCIIAAYLLGKRERFKAQARLVLYGLFSGKRADWIIKELHLTDEMFSGFIYGKLLDSFIIGVLCFVFVTIVRMPYAVLVSVIVGVTNIIPFFGPYLGAIPSALLILTVSPGKCLIFLLFIILLQQFDGNILGPAILGDRLGISGIWILFSILIFSSLWGLTGMIIGVPVFAVLYDLIRRFIFGCLRRRSQETMLDEYRNEFHPAKENVKSGNRAKGKEAEKK